ncbi:hypothetical protein ACF09E_01400 [Streptomyces sp. NPDC014891]|uniref:hypothetical protein n=1 Tax=Streptomyces sp. NPDC014891 TaxID=3364929 RepID=UPI0036FC2EFB
MGRSTRRLVALLPAMLCAVWSLLVLPAATPTGHPAAAGHAPAGTPVSAPAGTPVYAPAGTPVYAPAGTPVSAPTGTPHSAPAHGAGARASAPEPHFAPTAVVRLPAAVENPVRIPVTPPGAAAVPLDLSLPARGVLAGDPRRERAPPGAAHDPRAPRGPPSTRHS